MVRREQKVFTFIQKGRVNLLRGFIHETLRVQHVQDPLAFLDTQGPWRRWTFLQFGLRRIPFRTEPIHTGPADPKAFTSRLGADLRSEDLNGFH
jgi:hypothetical protein